MADNKKSFVLYTDSQGLINQLPDDVAGRLLKHIYAYVNDENPMTDELIVNIAFEPIKMQLKRDLIKWVDTKETKSINGNLGNLKRYNLDLYEKVLSNNITIKEALELAKTRKTSHSDISPSQNLAKLAVNDNVNVNVSVNDNVNVNEIKKDNINTATPFSFFNELILLGVEKELINEWLKVRKTKKLTNTKTAFKDFIAEVEKSKKPINEVLKKCVIKSWGGFKASWEWEENKTIVKPKFDPFSGPVA